MPTGKSQTLSLLLHLGVLAVLISLNSRAIFAPLPLAPAKISRLVFTPPREPARRQAAPAGGAARDQAPARHGMPPPRTLRYYIEPVVKKEPKLPLPVGIDFDVPTTVLAANIGDPYSKLDSDSLGNGGHGGIGNGGCCGGIGDHTGKPGIDGGGSGHPIVPARLIYKVEPEFSEEARKAKFQGTVVLNIEVDENGRPARLVVVSSPGLGLDQKAIDAVAQWRFRPAYRDGKPVATPARVEVNFHLL